MPALATLRPTPPSNIRILARMSLDTTPDEATPPRHQVIVHRRPVAASARAERPQTPRYDAVRILRLVTCLEALRARIRVEPDMEERWRLRGRFARVLEVYLRCF